MTLGAREWKCRSGRALPNGVLFDQNVARRNLPRRPQEQVLEEKAPEIESSAVSRLVSRCPALTAATSIRRLDGGYSGGGRDEHPTYPCCLQVC
jgi:hypothetical protein